MSYVHKLPQQKKHIKEEYLAASNYIIKGNELRVNWCRYNLKTFNLFE